MGLVALDNLKEGCILSQDVRDINGRLMLSKGQSVNSNHIRIFKIWGVPAIEVLPHAQGSEAGDAVEPSVRPEPDSVRLSKAETTARTILRNTDLRNPAIIAIFQAALTYRYKVDALVEFSPHRQLPENFKLNLAQGLKTQIQFTDLQLPEAPGIIMDFTQVIEDPIASADDIAEVINRSPSLAVLLLKLANSPILGLSSKIDTVSRAIAMIGVKEVGSLVLSISIMRLFFDIPKELVDMRGFLRHSLACGLLSRILAAHKKLLGTEQMFMAGLLHDVGRLVLYRYFPEQAKLLLHMARKIGWSLHEMENECLGIDHQQLAGLLIQKWKLPVALENKIVYHHHPSQSPDRLEAGIVHLADIAINALGLGHSGEQIIPRFEPAAWDNMDITPGTLKIAIAQTIEQMEIMEALFTEL